jgi:hypothetical protein
MAKTKDWTGQKFGMLTFVGPTNKKHNGTILWEIICDCGASIIRKPHHISIGKVKSCGCKQRKERKDFTGKKCGHLTFIRPTDKKSCRAVVWELRCDCGSTVQRAPYNVLRSTNQSCGKKCEYHIPTARKYDPVVSSARYRWRPIYSKDIDFETFFKLSQLPCDYCGILQYRTTNYANSKIKSGGNPSPMQIKNGDFTYNGLDRIDSTKGHTLDNVVPCCWPCNWAKSNRTREEFLAHIRMIFNHSLASPSF